MSAPSLPPLCATPFASINTVVKESMRASRKEAAERVKNTAGRRKVSRSGRSSVSSQVTLSPAAGHSRAPAVHVEGQRRCFPALRPSEDESSLHSGSTGRFFPIQLLPTLKERNGMEGLEKNKSNSKGTNWESLLRLKALDG